MKNAAEQVGSLLKSRREILFLYDIRMGNPNGDPDENRPRQLPDGTFYVTDVRLKRFARDYFKLRGKEILVDRIGEVATNLTGRLAKHEKTKGTTGKALVAAMLEVFVDARLFGSSLALKESKDWKPEPEPKTLTGAVQFNHGEVLHPAEEIQIKGTSIFASDEEKTQGTFTDYSCLRYGLIGFSGIANEHSAKLSKLTESDYDDLLRALWNGVRSAANTRTKTQQSPRLLVDIRYKPDSEYQIGNLINYIKAEGAEPKHWASCADYQLTIQKLMDKLNAATSKVERIQYAHEPDLRLQPTLPETWHRLQLDD
jgi:CRISPR-associated protein Csh2